MLLESIATKAQELLGVTHAIENGTCSFQHVKYRKKPFCQQE